jgi:peptidoglycan hydrolase CwlO-like protein
MRFLAILLVISLFILGCENANTGTGDVKQARLVAAENAKKMTKQIQAKESEISKLKNELTALKAEKDKCDEMNKELQAQVDKKTDEMMREQTLPLLEELGKLREENHTLKVKLGIEPADEVVDSNLPIPPIPEEPNTTK